MALLNARQHGGRLRLARSVAALLVLHAASVAPGRAAEGVQMMENQIKAGLIYSLLKYVDWPAESAAATSTTASVCIFGEDPFEGSLQSITGRTVNQRPIILRRIDQIPDTEHCHLLFVNAKERSRWADLSAFLAGKAVLTVSDFEAFAGSGGMIEFSRKDQHIDVAIDLEAVAAARLRVQDRLLKLAHIVSSGLR